MNSTYAIIILCLVVVFSCKNESKKENDERIEIQEILLIDNEQLKLNNGEKWIANNETHEGVKNMDSIIKAFKSVLISTPKPIVSCSKSNCLSPEGGLKITALTSLSCSKNFLLCIKGDSRFFGSKYSVS